RYQHEGHGRIDKVTDEKLASVDSECDGGEIGLADNRGNQRRHKILHERRDHGAKRAADDDRDGQIHDVATQQKLLESLQHTSAPSTMYRAGVIFAGMFSVWPVLIAASCCSTCSASVWFAA